jgi:hypothetical protein
MTHNPPARAWLWLESTRRRLALFTLVLFVLSTYGPGTLALAAPQLFARPGSGVSRLPLDVLAFDAPGFGEVADAINLASGSVYVDIGDLARANLSGGGDELVGTVGEAGWTLKPRLRLEQFRRNMTLAEAPAHWFMALGDGGGITFTRASLDWNALPLSVAPSWVRRYQGLNNVAIYRADDRVGTQPKVEFLVLVFSGGLAWAHYYDMAGNRHTFYADGPYLDYVQDPYQQYRSAQGGAPEGDPARATDFSYADTTHGRISRVRDEWGRTTDYLWNGNELSAIHYLLRDPANDPNSWTRRARFTYVSAGGQRLVGSVTYDAHDGLGNAPANLLSRTYTFSYEVRPNGRVLLSSINRPVLGDKVKSTLFGYDAYDRLTLVRQVEGYAWEGTRTEPDTRLPA